MIVKILCMLLILMLTGCSKGAYSNATISTESDEMTKKEYKQILSASRYTEMEKFLIRLDTIEELKEFKLQYAEELSLNTNCDEVNSFNENTEKYDEDFFADNTLMVIYFVSGYSSLRYEVCDIVTEGDKAVFKIMETTGSDAGDAEVAGWIITVAVPDEEAAEWNDYDVVSVDKI